MFDEISKGLTIAIGILLFLAVVTIVFVLLTFTRTSANEGTTSVQNTMDSMTLSQFDSYDQQILSGTQVASTIKMYEGRPIGIIVRTSAQMATTGETGHNYGAVFDKSVVDDPDVSIITEDISGMKGSNSFYTMNLKVTGSGGGMTYNMDYLESKTSGSDAYIRPTAKFLGELIKDSTGTIVGMVFTQQ
ncbi:hypothetical protein [Cytobacillus sp. IB215316]|uniref:hypothetical protein n=1 Tax=Cytobacillus sp. IB215316 TaxID=3097354 RepID=UPI002A0B391E|nr:hypothetical protein [Cytobacillus sp. IB215316]MDX8360765.1 hypothetical protein [Cytobacillus sp. IB215316]